MFERLTGERGVPLAFALAVFLSSALYFLFGDRHLDLADEGFLWYGVLRTRAGEIPLRDFQSYEPGRYYWSAAWSFVFGQGILGLRASLAIVQVLGLVFGILVCRRLTGNVAWLIACAGILSVWMFPRHKLFEPGMAMAAVWVAVRLIEAPSARRVFQAGLFAGFAAWVGRNHGLYSALALIATVAILFRAARLPPLGVAVRSFAVGVVAGSSPLWGMLVLVPGFAVAFHESIVFNVTRAVNLPLPYPWPWRFDLQGRHGLDLLAALGMAAVFVLPVLLYPAGLVAAVRMPPPHLRQRAPLVAATLVGIFVFHHASVRSEILHLAQAIHPLLILMFAMVLASPRAVVRVFGIVMIGGLTVLVVPNANVWVTHLWPGRQTPVVEHDVAGHRLQLPAAQAADLTLIETAIRSHVGTADTLFVAPTRPTFYPMFGKVSPVWWLYILFPLSDAAQHATIARLEAAGVRWVLLLDETVDGREDLRLRNSNPLVFSYLTGTFVDVDDAPLPPNYRLLRRRAP